MSLQASFPDRVSALHLRDSSMLMQPYRRRMLYTLFLQIFLPYCCAVHDIFCLPPRRFSQKILRLPLLTKAKNMIIISLSKKSLWTFSPSCFQNCKIEFCSIILQFCRCGGLLNGKGNPDGFLSHFSSLRNLRPTAFGRGKWSRSDGAAPFPLFSLSVRQINPVRSRHFSRAYAGSAYRAAPAALRRGSG